MNALLVKHPSESRAYTFDFTGQLTTSGRRGTVFAQQLLGTSEVFGAPLLLPLLLSMVPVLPTPTVSVARGDGGTSDLVVGAATVLNGQVSVLLSGGSDGQTYTVTVFVTSNQGNVLALQGKLLVSTSLP